MKHLSIIVLIVCLLILAGCGSTADMPAAADTSVIRNDAAAAAASAEAPGAEQYSADVRLSDGKAEIIGSGAALDGSTLRITEPGVYRLAGELNGAVVVDCKGEAELVLCGLRLRGAGFALYAKSCDALTLTTTADFGQSYLSCSDAEGIALSCEAPMTVRGEGWLTLQSEADGLDVGDRFTLQSGSLTVYAKGCGIKADCAALIGGSLTVDADGDALKGDELSLSGSSVTLTAGDEGIDTEALTVEGGLLTLNSEGNAVKADTITFTGGSGTIYAALDALQATEDITFTGGEYTITTANGAGMAYYHNDSGGFGGPGGWGGSSSTSYTLPDYSCKAIKSDASIHLLGGKLTLDSEDDAIHGTTELIVDGAELYVRSNDDAIHCDQVLAVNSGYILISSCFEGIEAETVTINGGYADIYSANDGINTSGSSGSGGFGWGGSSACFTMNGGEAHVYVFGSSNVGDGVDSNGDIIINGGYLTSSTLGGSMENGLDSGSSFIVNGGIVASSGNSGMQESAASTSKQCTAVLSLNTTIAADTECIVTDENGTVIMTYTPYRAATALIFSHPDFEIGKTYTVTAGSFTQSFTFDSVSYSTGRGGFGGFPF